MLGLAGLAMLATAVRTSGRHARACGSEQLASHENTPIDPQRDAR